MMSEIDGGATSFSRDRRSVERKHRARLGLAFYGLELGRNYMQ
jgi:hypothetical protein